MTDAIDDLAHAMTDPLDRVPGRYQAVVMLHNEHQAVTAIYGYDSDEEACADIVIHLRHLFARHGVQLVLAPLTSGPN